MNRKGIRQLAHETLGLPTSNYRFAATREAIDATYAFFQGGAVANLTNPSYLCRRPWM